MKHKGVSFAAGVILVAMPFLGFPSSWKNFFMVAVGLYICVVAFGANRNILPVEMDSKKNGEAPVAPKSGTPDLLNTSDASATPNNHDQNSKV